MIAFFYPESSELLAIFEDGGIASSDHLIDPSIAPGMMVCFTIIMYDGIGCRAISYLGYYIAKKDAFRYIIDKRTHSKGVLYDCGKYTIERFWPDKCPQTDFNDLYLNYIVSHCQNPISLCDKLNDEQTAQLLEFFDEHFALNADVAMNYKSMAWN